MPATPPSPPRDLASALARMRAPIVFDGSHSPLKSTLFLIVCSAWLLLGLIGHDPWKPDEALTWGVIDDILSHGNWLLPTVAGAPDLHSALLYHWVAACFAWLFATFLPLHDGARLASGLFAGLALLYTHKTACRLFDERAGRIAVLLLISCLGLVWRAHQLNAEVAAFAGYAIAIYGLTRIRTEPQRGGTTAGIGAGLVALSVGLVAGLMVPIMALALMAMQSEWRNRDFRRGIGWLLLALAPITAIYPLLLLAAGSLQPTVLHNAVLGLPPFGADTWRLMQPGYFISILPWYAIPALPLALWLWWRDRAKLRERIELALPFVSFFTALLLLSFLREATDDNAMVLLIPLALAGAQALDRLPRGIAGLIDAFSVVFFGLCIVAIWLYWTAAVTGTPATAAGVVAREAPGFKVQFVLAPFIVAALLSLVWMYAVVRAHRSNRRAIVNWAAGVTLVWTLLTMLGLPAFDWSNTYRGVAATVSARLPVEHGCVAQSQLGAPQQAMFAYFAKLRFVPLNADDARSCEWLLTQGTRDRQPVVSATWQKVWEGGRPGDRREVLRLYRRAAEPS